jgi:hypothetical protein
MLIGKRRRAAALTVAVSTVLGVGVRADDREFAARRDEATQAALRCGQGLLLRRFFQSAEGSIR